MQDPRLPPGVTDNDTDGPAGGAGPQPPDLCGQCGCELRGDDEHGMHRACARLREKINRAGKSLTGQK